MGDYYHNLGSVARLADEAADGKEDFTWKDFMNGSVYGKKWMNQR